MDVKIKNAPVLTHAQMTATVNLAHEIAQWNRNSTAGRKIQLITDDIDEAFGVMMPHHRPAAQRRWAAKQNKPLGITYTPQHGVIIYLSPQQSNDSYVLTFAHEVSHALTRTAHGFTWRRMYTMLTPLAAEFLPLSGTCNVRKLVQVTVDAYRGDCTQYWRARNTVDARTDEIDKHIRAAERCKQRFAPLVQQIQDQLN